MSDASAPDSAFIYMLATMVSDFFQWLVVYAFGGVAFAAGLFVLYRNGCAVTAVTAVTGLFVLYRNGCAVTAVTAVTGLFVLYRNGCAVTAVTAVTVVTGLFVLYRNGCAACRLSPVTTSTILHRVRSLPSLSLSLGLDLPALARPSFHLPARRRDSVENGDPACAAFRSSFQTFSEVRASPVVSCRLPQQLAEIWSIAPWLLLFVTPFHLDTRASSMSLQCNGCNGCNGCNEPPQ